VQVPVETVPPGLDVRVYLTRQGMADLPDLPDQGGPFLSGRLLRRDDQQLFVSVPVARRQEGFYSSQIGQEVGIRTGEIVQLERRQLNRASTGLFVAGTAVAAATVIFAIIDASRRPDQQLPPGPEEFRVPLFSFPVR
jgi:hypothetical protein